jgi:hypothetical protein
LKDVSKMRLLFIGLIPMCVGLGMVLTIALENWLQGNSYLWRLLLVLLANADDASFTITGGNLVGRCA